MDSKFNINHIQLPALSVSFSGKILQINDHLESILPSSPNAFNHISEILIDIKQNNDKKRFLDHSRLIGNEKDFFLILTTPSINKENLIILFPSDTSKNLYLKANYDSLTNLPNRSLLLNRLEIALELAKRNKSQIALFFIDLDNFKNINDQYGHNTGDIYLCKVGEILTNSFRKTDTVSRWGGDEFLILCTNFGGVVDIKILCDRLIENVHNKIEISSKYSFQLELSIGIALYPDNATEMDSLIEQADKAMYIAKERLGSAYEIL